MTDLGAGIHDGLPLDDYLRDPAPTPSLSASLAHVLLTQSPRHAWLASRRLNADWAPETSEASDLGTVVHALLLEGDESRVRVIEADTFRGALARGQRDEARATGQIPMLAAKMDTARAIVTAARQQIAASELAAVFADGHAEQTLLWREGGHWCRARPDWLSTDRRVIVDLKTTATSAAPDVWARRQLLEYGYDLQAALALRGVSVLAHPRDCTVVFAVVETAPPYATSLVGLSPAWLAWADQRLDYALDLWADCLRHGRWPGYPARVCYAEPPGYAVSQWDDRYAQVAPTVRAVEGEGIEAL